MAPPAPPEAPSTAADDSACDVSLKHELFGDAHTARGGWLQVPSGRRHRAVTPTSTLYSA